MPAEAPQPVNRRVLSGMRPTGKLHIGHYVGALQNWVRLQENYDCFFFVADWHALTTDYADTSRVKDNILEMTFDWLAAGLDPERATIFIQSHVPQHAELHLLLSMMTPLGWLERVPTYKEQKENLKEKDLNTYGFLGYPVLMTSDILMYQASFVPVGEDQVPHVEITREIARRFNQFYWLDGERRYNHDRTLNEKKRVMVFPEPQPLLTPAAKLPGTDGRKMSKSYGNGLLMSDPEPVLRQKLKTMVTDPARVRRTDAGDPAKCPVFDLHKIFSSRRSRLRCGRVARRRASAASSARRGRRITWLRCWHRSRRSAATTRRIRGRRGTFWRPAASAHARRPTRRWSRCVRACTWRWVMRLRRKARYRR